MIDTGNTKNGYKEFKVRRKKTDRTSMLKVLAPERGGKGGKLTLRTNASLKGHAGQGHDTPIQTMTPEEARDCAKVLLLSAEHTDGKKVGDVSVTPQNLEYGVEVKEGGGHFEPSVTLGAVTAASHEDALKQVVEKHPAAEGIRLTSRPLPEPTPRSEVKTFEKDSPTDLPKGWNKA